MNKQKRIGLISFSGGETSGYMLYWLLKTNQNDRQTKTKIFKTKNGKDCKEQSGS